MKSYSLRVVCSILFVVTLVSIFMFCAKQEDPAFVEAEMSWRAERDESMKSETSWLTIAGLFWLEEGKNSFGTGEEVDIRLPVGSAPEEAGSFGLRDGIVTVFSHRSAELTCEGEDITRKVLKSDQEGRPDIISLNDLRMWVIVRGGRHAIRLRDFNAPRYTEYTGLDFYEPKGAYKIKGRFIPFDEPQTVTVGTVIGTESEMSSPGYVEFEVKEIPCRLDAFGNAESKRLFFVFRDGTSGEETYGASRFMGAEIMEDGSVDMNFNRAYNPPCAYTPYATCPLPPLQNNLTVRIEAGEKMYPGHH